MMDFHILIVIACVFLASLFSWLFLNKFFRRKTFDEVIAEKKALTEKINAQNKALTKKPKKLQNMKKEQKREKKQRQKEEKNKDTTEHDDSDTQSEKPSVEGEPPRGLSKTHVEFEPDPEIVHLDNETEQRRQSNAEQLNVGGSKHKSKKDKKTVGKAYSSGGILHNKNEPVAIKANVNVEETLNNFEAKPPKDMVELKKADKERKEEKAVAAIIQQQPQTQNVVKKEKHPSKKEKPVTAAIVSAVEQLADVPLTVAKELKQNEDKVRQASPKNQQNGQSGHISSKGSKQQHKKQGNKEANATKGIANALDKLSDSDTVSVNILMNLFRRAELNRSEIQILIDYLLNKQQDMPESHSEWSDDICQKLKRQLEEKERALAEEQEASAGIQAKLRELRTEINAERLQLNATMKAYKDKLLSKDQEISGLNQELQTVNEKLSAEQFQAKLLREKQDMLAQLPLMQKELAHKDKCINELTCMVNASRQAVEESQKKNDIIQAQAQQIRALEQQRDELEQVSNNRIFELEKLKEIETENAEIKVELRNLQNALESSKTDLAQARKELEMVNSELALARTVELSEKQQQIQALQAQNAELLQQLALLKSRKEEQHTKEQTGMQATLDALRIELAEKEKQLTEFVAKNTELLQQNATTSQQYGQLQQELQQRIESLTVDVATKHKQLQDVERHHAEKYTNREKELLQQLQEQREKNNDLRMKNWKLVEALQNAETTVLKENKMLSKQNDSLVQIQQQQQQFQVANSNSRDEKQLRELFQRICPDAVKACSGSALSLPFDQWIEQVLTTHIKQSITNASSVVSSSNKSTQSNSTDSSHNNSNSNHNSSHNSHNNNNNNKNNNNSLINASSVATTTTTNNNNNNNNNSNSSRTSHKSVDNISKIDPTEHQKLLAENAQLRIQNSELTRLVTKTSHTLSELEGQAREQDENWRSIVRSKDEKIHALQHSNGEQDI